MKFKEYFKWLFTRWYLYVLMAFHLIVIDSWADFYMGFEPLPFDIYDFLGGLIGTIILYGSIISIVVGIKKLFSFLFTSRNNS